MIVVAHDISPADMLQFRDRSFIGFITDVGGQNSHTAIVARSLDIPAAVGMSQASMLIEQDDWLIIDGDAGVVIANPSALVLEQYRERQAAMQRARKKLGKLKKTPAVTNDGTEITLLANIELPEDCAAALESGASGVGLFRSEFLFMGRAQQDSHRGRAVRGVPQHGAVDEGPPVTIRTLDIGADKPLDQTDHTALNPALGLRAIRYCLAEPQIVPDAAARHSARLGLRQGAHPDPDAGACVRDRPVAGHDRAGQGQLREEGVKFDDAGRSGRHDRDTGRRAGAAACSSSAWTSCRSAPMT